VGHVAQVGSRPAAGDPSRAKRGPTSMSDLDE